MSNNIIDKWNSGETYELFMGRWSRLMAKKFLDWLEQPRGLRWLDLGSGTGALTDAIVKTRDPISVTSVDPSAAYIDMISNRWGEKIKAVTGTASDIPVKDNSIDMLVSGLALNFFPDIKQAMIEMIRVTRPDGIIAAYVWDYSGKMEFLRYFWDEVVRLDPAAREFDEGLRFPLCHEKSLTEIFDKSGLHDIRFTVLDIETNFNDFDDYWTPFLGGQGPAPGYVSSLDENTRIKLIASLKKSLPYETDGSIKLIARALAISAKKPLS